MPNCSYCGDEYEFKEGRRITVYCPKCTEADFISKDMPPDRYRLALVRLMEIVVTTPLSFYDDTTIGSKNNECTWGICQETVALWPDAEDHKWPYAFTTRGRIAPLSRLDGQLCPLDMDIMNVVTPEDLKMLRTWGCFYRCRVFSGPSPKLLGPQMVLNNINKLLRLYPEEGFPDVAERAAELHAKTREMMREEDTP